MLSINFLRQSDRLNFSISLKKFFKFFLIGFERQIPDNDFAAFFEHFLCLSLHFMFFSFLLSTYTQLQQMIIKFLILHLLQRIHHSISRIKLNEPIPRTLSILILYNSHRLDIP